MHVPTSPNGRPFARQVAILRCALLARLTEQDLEAVAEALLRQAKEGNVAAARLLLSYMLGQAPTAGRRARRPAP
jgi:hypothetical protein